MTQPKQPESKYPTPKPVELKPYPNSPQPFDEGDRTERLEQLAESQRHPRDESGF